MDSVTDVIWLSYHKPEILARGYWDQAVIEEVFAVGGYKHHDGINAYWNDATNDGAIVVINGRTHAERKDLAKLNNDIQALRWVALIVTGDEESLFDHTQVKHPLLKTWVQLPRINKHNDVYKLVNGYRPETREKLRKIGELHSTERELDWSFVGQITHDRRKEMMFATAGLTNGFFHATDSFGGTGTDGMDYTEYLDTMIRSKFVLCPSGPCTPDSFRVWEALEAGCLPIVDSYATATPERGFWEYLLGNDLPFPIVEKWSELVDLLPQLEADYPHNVNRAYSWWQLKKREIRKQLESDASVWR